MSVLFVQVRANAGCMSNISDRAQLNFWGVNDSVGSISRRVLSLNTNHFKAILSKTVCRKLP